MDKQLRILHLEDQPDFSALVSALLEKEGLSAKLELVTDFTSFIAALEKPSYDVIIADYSLPTCNGMQALLAAQQKCPAVPFLLLSGAIGEHAAVDILRSGATDYVLKSGLERLVPAIRRAVQEVRERDQRRHAESDARVSERQYRVIFNGSPVPMWVSDLKSGAFLEVNDAAVRHYGFPRDEFLALKAGDISLSDEAAKLKEYLAGAIGKSGDAEFGRAGSCRHRKKNGAVIDVDVTWSIIQFQDRDALLTIANDITEFRPATEMLKKNEARLAAAERIARTGSWELDLNDLENLDRNKLRCSDETLRILGFRTGKIPVAGEFFFNPVHPEDMPSVKDALRQAFRSKEPYEIEHRVLLPDGQLRSVRIRAEFVLDSSGRPAMLRGIVMEVARPTRSVESPAPVKDGKPAGDTDTSRRAKPAKAAKTARATVRSRR